MKVKKEKFLPGKPAHDQREWPREAHWRVAHSSRFWLDWGTNVRTVSCGSSDTSSDSSGSPSPGLTSWPSTCPHCCRASDLSAACPSCPGRCLPVQELNSASSPCHR